MEHRKHKRKLNHLASMPFIYGLIPSLLLLHVFLEIYHQVSFRLYHLPLVNRSSYIRIDRHKLSYLTPIQKLNCLYCSYANGLLRYAAQIAAETEKYWCGIKHKPSPEYIEPEHHAEFTEYANKKQYEQKYPRHTPEISKK
jgi:hypothetical protein